jgi:hypothetical protein
VAWADCALGSTARAQAALDTAIIVGCGEPFDPSTIPYDILEFHLQGGGRAAAKKVKHQLAVRDAT